MLLLLLSFIQLTSKQSITTTWCNGMCTKPESLTDLPLIHKSSKGQQIRFDWLTEESLPEVFDMIQRIGIDAEGIDPDLFYPMEKLRNTMLPIIRKKAAFESECLHN